MTQCNTANVNLSQSRLNKLKSTTKNETGVTLKISSDMIDHANDEINFPYKLLLT